MTSSLERYGNDLKELLALGGLLLVDLQIRSHGERNRRGKRSAEAAETAREFEENYQGWYTESCALIRQTVPERLAEFETLYKGDGRRKQISLETYSIQDWLLGIRAGKSSGGEKVFDDLVVVVMRCQAQVRILSAVQARFKSSLFSIKALVRAETLDSELESARELHENGFLRAAGVVAGVVLEGHLSQVCAGRSLIIAKKDPQIHDYSDALKNNNLIDIPQWRFVQRLADLRNLCAHKKNREPKAEEVLELIDGVDKTTKTIY